MTAFNVVRFRVKPRRGEEFVNAHRDAEANFPGMRRVALVKTGERAYCVIGEWEDTARLAGARKQLRADAAVIDVQLQVVEVKAKGDFDAAVAAIRLAKTQAIMMPPEPLIVSQRDAIGEFARAQGLPVAAVGRAASLQSGALLAFVPAQSDFAQIAARQVDHILKGAKPAKMPIEQPTHYELRLNQRAARALGVTLPQAMLLRADEVME